MDFRRLSRGYLPPLPGAFGKYPGHRRSLALRRRCSSPPWRQSRDRRRPGAGRGEDGAAVTESHLAQAVVVRLGKASPVRRRRSVAPPLRGCVIRNGPSQDRSNRCPHRDAPLDLGLATQSPLEVDEFPPVQPWIVTLRNCQQVGSRSAARRGFHQPRTTQVRAGRVSSDSQPLPGAVRLDQLPDARPRPPFAGSGER